MVALNLANELMRLKNHDAKLEKLESDASGRVRALRERVESAIERASNSNSRLGVAFRGTASASASPAFSSAPGAGFV